VKMLQQGDERDARKEVPIRFSLRTIRWILLIIFLALYLLTSVLSTALTAKEIAKRYEGNLCYVEEHLATIMRDENYSLNSIYYINAIDEDYQQFSAAVYNKQGQLLRKTEPYVCFKVDEKLYFFPWDSYFSEKDQEYLSQVGSINFPYSYMIKAEIDIENESLQSLEFKRTASDSNPGESVWKWTNPNPSKGEVKDASVKGKVSGIISNPYYNNEKLYERWTEDKYLREFDEEIEVKSLQENDSQKVLTVLEKDNEQILVLRTSMYPVKAAMDRLADTYFLGGIITAIAVFLVIFMTKHVKEAHQ
jgi:hypothetical protein